MPQTKAAVVVGEAEEIIRPQPRLHVLEGDVVDVLAAGERVADVGKHLPRGRPDVDLVRRNPERTHQQPGIRLGPLRRGKAGQRVGEHVLPRQPKLIHGASRNDQRLGGIETARNADDDLF